MLIVWLTRGVTSKQTADSTDGCGFDFLGVTFNTNLFTPPVLSAVVIVGALI